jgi:acetylornithine deacetylase/succinyl-diaminopimelate desuccinylase family protein
VSAVVELLQELIRIPSANPVGDVGAAETGEGALAQFVGDQLLKLGMEVELQFVEPQRPNVVGRLKSRNSRHHLLLGPHLDTVGIKGMTIEPFAGTVRDGRVWGRGACDTKGSIASMLAALEALVRGDHRPEDTDIWFAGLMGEETGNEGISFLLESDFFPKKDVRMDFGIAGEPTLLKIVNRHKGALWLRVRTQGRSCHASMPDLGDNAILKMRRVLDYVTGELPAIHAQRRDEFLGRASFSVTTIRGGTQVNVIPDRCEIEIDHRALPSDSTDAVIETVKKALPDCTVEVISNRRGLDTPPDNPYIQTLAGVLGQCLPGKTPKEFLTGAPWFADCSVMSHLGIPSIAFGPGSSEPAHTKDEYIEIDQLEKGVTVFQRFLEKLE